MLNVAFNWFAICGKEGHVLLDHTCRKYGRVLHESFMISKGEWCSNQETSVHH